MRTPALLLTLAATPLLAQTSKPPVHRSTATHAATAAHTASTAHHGACGSPLPEISAKIPSLPTTAPKCPTTEYSLTYIDTKIGDGEPAVARRWYTVRYTGYLPDGTKFDSSYDHPGAAPISFPYGAHQVIAGWDTGFEGMRVGGKRRLFVPYQLAYGELGRPPVIPPKTMLIFDVELVSQSATRPEPPKPPAAPAGAPGSTAPSTPPPAGAAPGTAAPSSPAPGAPTTPAPTTPPSSTTAPAAAPSPSPAGTAAPPPVTSTTPSSSTQPTQPSTTTEPKK